MSRVGCSFVLIVRQSEERYHTVNNRKRKSPLSADCGFETERKTLLQGGYVHRTPFTVQTGRRCYEKSKNKGQFGESAVHLIVGQNLKCSLLLVFTTYLFAHSFKIKATAVPILNLSI
jgi:hypothetical protein